MIDCIINDNCTGCHCCINICSNECINMNPNNEGFLYPVVNYSNCINCGKCVSVCPIINKNDLTNNPIAYACFNKDKIIRLNSSSGGIFTILAEKVIDCGGVVIGAVFNKDFEVKHDIVETYENIRLLRGSKYVQSTVGYTYKKTKDFLLSGRKVLFSGTPCQIAGLKTYLSKPYPNLITVDIICHGVPSPYVWKTYIQFRESKAGSKIKSINFRSKNTGWKQYSVLFSFVNNSVYNKIFSEDIYMKAFLKNICLRPSCYNCNFRSLNRQSDITLADFWGIQNLLPDMDDDNGTSLIFLNSQKGRQVFKSISNNIFYKEVEITDAVKYNISAIISPEQNLNRKEFFKNLSKLPFDKLVKKYCKDSLLFKIKSFVKNIINY